MSPKGKTSIVIEVPCSNEMKDDNDDTKIYNDIKSFLIDKQFITDDEIIDYKVLSMPFAYPVLSNSCSHSRKSIFFIIIIGTIYS